MAPVPEIWNSISETHPRTAHVHGRCFSSFNTAFVSGKCLCIYPELEWKRIAGYLVRRFIRDKHYFPKVKQLHKKFGRQAEQLVERLEPEVQQLAVSDLLTRCAELRQAWLNFDEVNVLPWYVGGDALRDHVATLLQKKFDCSREEIDLLCAADRLSLATEEQIALNRTALRLRGHGNLQRFAERLSENFGWIPFGYDGPSFWDARYYRLELTRTARRPARQIHKVIAEIRGSLAKTLRQQQSIVRRKRIPGTTVKLLQILRDLFVLTDERKKVQFKIHNVYHHCLSRLATASKFSVDELKQLDVPELLIMFEKNLFQKYHRTVKLRERGPLCFYTSRGLVRKIFTGHRATSRLKRFTLTAGTARSFSGQVANGAPGDSIRGTVCRIMSSRDCGRMQQDKILVTSMTTPDFVPAMRRARAIVTDEGGVTSHAAIVSRELGVPCIIGTRVATHILKNGDLVDLDTRTGTITLLS